MNALWTHPSRIVAISRIAMMALLVAVGRSYAFDLSGWLGLDGDSGSGNYADLAFHLRENFIPTSIVWSPDGRYIASTGTQTRTLHIWDVTTKQIIRSMELPGSPAGLFHNMAWSPDGRYLALCNSFSSSLRVYETSTWSVAKDFGRLEAGGCQKPLFSDDGRELAVWAGDVVTWNVEDWHETRRFDWDVKLRARDMVYIPGSHTLVISGGRYEDEAPECNPRTVTYTARLWMLEPQAKTIEQSFVVYCSNTAGGTDAEHIAISPNRTHAAVAVLLGNRRRVVDVLSVPDGQMDWKPVDRAPGEGISAAVNYTSDGRFLLVGIDHGHASGEVLILDPASRQELDRVRPRGGGVHDLAITKKSDMFAAAAGAYITVWKFKSK